jgi:tetratricopeptide (TPR) repeat protein
MSKISVPSFLQLLDLLIDAFHLDENANDLHGRGRFQAYLTGRSLDLSDQKLDALLRLISKSLLDSRVFPALRATLRDALPNEPTPLLREYLGEAASMPRLTGDLPRDMAHRLKWLLVRTEDFLGQARSQEPAALGEARHVLLPLARFVGHHISIAFGLLHSCGHVDLERLPGSLETSWVIAEPTVTPLSKACGELGLSQADVVSRLRGLSVHAKTVANLWHGGDDHPQLGTLRAVLAGLFADSETTQAAELPVWRRWYGLRHLGQQMAALWGWEVVGGLGGDMLFGAGQFAHALASSSLRPPERKAVVSVGIWAGWRMGIGRWMFGETHRLGHDHISPIVRDDYLAIAENREHLRLQHCFQIASGGKDLEAELQRRGRDEAQARSEAMQILQGMQSDWPELVGRDPFYDFHSAMAKHDLPRAEVAARTLVDRRPDLVGNHLYLTAVLAAQDKFDEALVASQQALALHPDDLHLLQRRANTLMERGHAHDSAQDFEAARDLLTSPLFREHWSATLDLADCYFALGDWAAAQSACARCLALHDECGEAYAIDSICSLRLGDQKRANKSAEYASRRGAGPFLVWLKEHDLRGSLGSQQIVPPPRWHRMRYW